MPRIARRIWFPDEWAAGRRRYVDARHFDSVIRGISTDVYRGDGSLLLRYVPRALRPEAGDFARAALRVVGSHQSGHRDFCTGHFGFFDTGPTAFNRDRPREYLRIWPFAEELNRAFRRHLPSKYIPQRRLARRTDPERVIGDTCFTTGTANLWDADHDARSWVHRDSGNLAGGFSVQTVLRSGRYEGGVLIFPRYRVAVDLKETDVLFFDPSEPHGNGPIQGEPGWARISVILYFWDGLRPLTG